MKILFDRAFDGFSQIAVHEAGSIDGHLLALRERIAVARKARGVGELLRNQFDLIPETQARLSRDQRRRRQIFQELRQKFSANRI